MKFFTIFMKTIFLIVKTTSFLIPFNPFTEPYYPPICKNCKNIDGEHCKLFGNIDLISGKKSYLSCKITRQNETMCGIKGKFYTKYISFTEEDEIF